MFPIQHHRMIVRLYSFMLTFNIDRFELLSVSDHRIAAKVGWPDEGIPEYDSSEETQCISWDFRKCDEFTDDALGLLMLLSEGGYIDNDKVLLSHDQICQHPAVTNLHIDNLERVIEALLGFSIDMVDDGEFTDSFFLHFQSGESRTFEQSAAIKYQS